MASSKKKVGIDLEIVKPNREGLFDLADFEKASKNAKLVSITHASNSLGCLTPIEKISKIAKENNSLLLVDGAQSVPHMKVDVKKLGCDFLVFSSHKMLGPTGVGVVYMRKGLVDKLTPPILGGGTINKVTYDDFQLAKLPDRWEAGTPDIAGVIGLGAAIEYLEKIGLKNVEKHEKELTKIALEGLTNIDKVEVYGPKELDKKVGIISFNIGKMNSHDAASMLDNLSKIEVRSGHHCAMPVMNEIIKKPEGTVRASFYIYNTKEEVEKLIKTVKEITKMV